MWYPLVFYTENCSVLQATTPHLTFPHLRVLQCMTFWIYSGDDWTETRTATHDAALHWALLTAVDLVRSGHDQNHWRLAKIMVVDDGGSLPTRGLGLDREFVYTPHGTVCVMWEHVCGSMDGCC